MDITIAKTITTNGKFSLEVTGDYSKDKKVLDKIYSVVAAAVTGSADELTEKLWNSAKALAEAKRKIEKLQEKIEIDNIQIAHYDDELKQAKSLLSGMVVGAAVTESALNFLNRKEIINHDKNSDHDS